MIKSEYKPNDPSLPLVISETAPHEQTHGPIGGLVRYVRQLFEAGYSPKTLLNEYSDLYHLDYYVAQVKNGGNSQFIHNSFDLLEQNLEGAARGARTIGLPELANIVDRCAEFCRQNPEEASIQDGADNRAPELEVLDDELYELKFSEEERAEYFASLPEDTAALLRAKLELPPNLEKVATAVEDAVMERIDTKTLEAAVREGLRCAEAAFAHKARVTWGPLPAERLEKLIQIDIDQVVTLIKITIDNRRKGRQKRSVFEIVKEHFSEPDPDHLSRYFIHSFTWITCHPNLMLVPEDEITSTIEKVVAASPFALAEQAERAHIKKADDLEELTNAIPDDKKFALAIALASVQQTTNTGPFFTSLQNTLDHNSRYLAAFLIETTIGEMCLFQTEDTVSLFEVRNSIAHKIWFKFLSYLRRKDILDAAEAFKLSKKIPTKKPGKLLARAKILSGFPQLFKDLRLPEAVLLWTDHKEKDVGFHWGVLDEYNLEHRFVTWRFKVEERVFIAKANPGGVHLSDLESGREVHFPIAMLKSVRLDAEAARQLRDEK